MKEKIADTIKKRKKNLSKRLENINEERDIPMFGTGGAEFDISVRISAIHCGGIGVVHELMNRIGLPDIINEKINVFKRHNPYFESDHILNMAYNIVNGGNCLDDIELLRNNEAYMDALGTVRIPDPTTAGDFLRRFGEKEILMLSEVIDIANTRMWNRLLPLKARNVGIIDVDGKIQATTGECKEGMDISYNGKWGFSVLLLTEATTGAHLNVVNRPGNSLSQEGADEYIDRSIRSVKKSFKKVIVRGDSAFSLTWKFDEWTKDNVGFIFGYDAHPNMIKFAENLGENSWRALKNCDEINPLKRRRKKKPRIKEGVVKRREYKNITQTKEYVSEFNYQPGKCDLEYRVIVARKHMEISQGQQHLFDDYRYFFYITNIMPETPQELVRLIRGRCNHENKIEQMANGVCALKMPAAEFMANWAYMMIGALAWNMKSYLGLVIHDKGKSAEIIKCEFKRFQNLLINIPCQILTTGRKIVFRFLNYSEWVEILFSVITRIKILRFS